MEAKLKAAIGSVRTLTLAELAHVLCSMGGVKVTQSEVDVFVEACREEMQMQPVVG